MCVATEAGLLARRAPGGGPALPPTLSAKVARRCREAVAFGEVAERVARARQASHVAAEVLDLVEPTDVRWACQGLSLHNTLILFRCHLCRRQRRISAIGSG